MEEVWDSNLYLFYFPYLAIYVDGQVKLVNFNLFPGYLLLSHKEHQEFNGKPTVRQYLFY